MLKELHIRGLAIIKDLKVNFSKGLNIITGETGAGKTLVVSSINLLQGERIPSSLRGREIKISAVIENFSEEVKRFLEEKGLYADGDLTIRRIINEKGESKNYVNDFPVKLSILKELGKLLFEISSQTEHITLLDVRTHRKIIDAYSGIEKEVEKFSKLFNESKKIQKELKEYEERKEDIEDEIRKIEDELNELKEANIGEKEEEELREEYEELEELKKKEEIFTSTNFVLYEKEESLYEVLSKIEQELEELKGKEILDVRKKLKKILIEIEDLSENIRDLREKIEFSSEKLQEIEERLNEIHRLKYKYGDDLFLAIKDREKKLKELISYKENGESLKKKYYEIEKKVFEISKILSSKRIENSKRFEIEVNEEIKSIGMEDVRFKVVVEEKEISFDGKDRIEFFVKTNPGEDFKPLKEIASGGERSRFLLSIRNAMRKNLTKVIIFDEIDQGLSFSAGKRVGGKLKEVSLNNQVICITHLASIAAYAEKHFSVEKIKEKDKTEVFLKELDREERKNEISRMMFGKIDEESKRQSEKFLKSINA